MIIQKAIVFHIKQAATIDQATIIVVAVQAFGANPAQKARVKMGLVAAFQRVNLIRTAIDGNADAPAVLAMLAHYQMAVAATRLKHVRRCHRKESGAGKSH